MLFPFLLVRMQSVMADGIVMDGAVAASESQAAAMWRVREGVAEACSRKGGYSMAWVEGGTSRCAAPLPVWGPQACVLRSIGATKGGPRCLRLIDFAAVGKGSGCDLFATYAHAAGAVYKYDVSLPVSQAVVRVLAEVPGSFYDEWHAAEHLWDRRGSEERGGERDMLA